MEDTLWSGKEFQEIENSFRDEPDHEPHTPETHEDAVEEQLCEESIVNECDWNLMYASLLSHTSFRPPGMDVSEVTASDSTIRPVPLLRETFNFQVDRQARPGAHHGLGGRPRGMTGAELQKSITPQVASKICRFLFKRCGGHLQEVADRLKDALLDVVRSSNALESVDIPQTFCANFGKYAGDIMRTTEKSGYEIISAPFLAVCFKAPRVGVTDHAASNPMSRHCACTWLDVHGRAHCTCVGSTLYRVGIDARSAQDENDCAHIKGIREVTSAISCSLNVSNGISGQILARFVISACGTELSEYTSAIPKLHFTHNDSIAVVSTAEITTRPHHVLFVPVRKIKKRSLKYVCAFCDNVLSNTWYHTRTVSLILNERESELEDQSHTTGQENVEFESHTTEKSAISCLPLAPVNCAKSLEVDDLVSSLARESEMYIVRAPQSCAVCGSARREGSRKVWNNGVLMCTAGPCKMGIEEYECSSDTCVAQIRSEGRDNCVILDNLSSAATHALMRREIYGVVISNGTLTGRLRHFHSLVTANAYFGVIPSEPSCRSVKTLLKLCTVMLRLMCLSPSKTLFRCLTCEPDSERKPLLALCMDGISQGFVKTSSRRFDNISEKCVALKPCTTVTRGRAEALMRPLTSIVRELRPVTILFDAIKGKTISCTSANEKDFACAVRMVSDLAIPSSFHSSVSVCGRSRGDISEDLGPSSTLSSIRMFLTSVFDDRVLPMRLLKPLKDHVQDEDVVQHIENMLYSALHFNPSEKSTNEICWKSSVPANEGCHIRNDIFNLARLILQGPILQFAQKSHATSLKKISDLCCDPDLSHLQSVLDKPELLEDLSSEDTNILLSLRILLAGIFSITKLETSGTISEARRSIGALLRSCHKLLIRFHAFYDSSSRTDAAFSYRNRWSSSNPSQLRYLMEERYGSIDHTSKMLFGNEYQIALLTGAYFPDRPQLRPLPFNDEQCTSHDFETVATCSKDFLQRQKSFTPGALTFCCSCTHPKILGFKVLYRNEGPRAILDTVVSRFAAFPKYLVYDFCCGLFVSAIHCLWWAIANISIVCDNFHFSNHSCSPGYSPKVHTILNATNTVAHEQRNRAICRLGLSLRNCNQSLYVSLLAYQTIVLNIRAQAKGTALFHCRTKLYSDFDIEWCYFHCLGLECTCCQT